MTEYATLTDPAIDSLFDAQTIRQQSLRIYQVMEQGQTHFDLNAKGLDKAIELVTQSCESRYPDFNIPLHSRWNHLKADGGERYERLLSALKNSGGAQESLTALLDLTIVAVLLDAGAGSQWQYQDEQNRYQRSEGLAMAVFDAFLQGHFSNDPQGAPCRVDAERLIALSDDDLHQWFQANDRNPLFGLDERRALMQRLGQHLLKSQTLTLDGATRPGHLLTQLNATGLTAPDVLSTVLKHFAAIWPKSLHLNGQALGDAWHYHPFGPNDDPMAIVPFHKLSQWLSYSLIDVLLQHNHPVTQVNDLTALAEYRNGGLLIDCGALVLRDRQQLKQTHTLDSELVIEWRALTIVLIDQIATGVRAQLGLSAEQLPLSSVLEGGTWHAGRDLANARDKQGNPPLQICRDGTIF